MMTKVESTRFHVPQDSGIIVCYDMDILVSWAKGSLTGL